MDIDDRFSNEPDRFFLQPDNDDPLILRIPSNILRLGDPFLLLKHNNIHNNISVYCLENDSSKKPLVLKVISCGNDSIAFQKTMHEIRVLTRLRGISQAVQLHGWDMVEDDSGITAFFVEDFAEPFRLGIPDDFYEISQFPDGYYDPLGALRIIKGICEALINFKKAGVFHFGISPKSFLVRGESVVFCDFSASLFSDEMSLEIICSQQRGDPCFMAPEVYREGRCSEQSDIYSVGLLLYFLFHHRILPFMKPGSIIPGKFESFNQRKERWDANEKRVAGNPFPKIHFPDPMIRHRIQSCIETACAFNPEQRYTSFEQMLRSIEGIHALLISGSPQNSSGFQSPSDPDDEELFPSPSAMRYGSRLQSDDSQSRKMEGSQKTSATPHFSSEHKRSDHLPGFHNSAPSEALLYEDEIPFSTRPSVRPSAPKASQSEPIQQKTKKKTRPKSVSLPHPRSIDIGAPSFPKDSVRSRKRSPKAKVCACCGSIISFQDLFCPVCGTETTATRNGVDIRNVQFSAVAPRRIVKGSYSIIDLIMYEESFRGEVDSLIKRADTPVSEAKSGVFAAETGSMIKVCLSSPDLSIPDSEEIRQWCGEYVAFSFAVQVPADYSKRQILFCASIYKDDVILTRLKFCVKCFSIMEQKLKIERDDVLSVFVSYAHEDRSRVTAIIQGMKKVRPEMDVFFDIASLRSGEYWEKTLQHEIDNRDILYLFWSENAKRSEWVDKEWRYALLTKGIDSIEPVPIEMPIPTPPKELSKKHFNDALLYFSNQ